MTRIPGPIQWFGGKGRVANMIVSCIPGSFRYVEPFGGGASVLCALEPRPHEVYNDLDSELVNLFRVLQDPETHAKLKRMLNYTPYARDEFRRALKIKVETDESILSAWAFFVRQNQGFGGAAESWGRSWRSHNGMAEQVSAFQTRVKNLDWYLERMRRVMIENRDALEVIRYWDAVETCFYIDPPYVFNTRKGRKYKHECTDEYHTALIGVLCEIKGQCVVSGYDSPVYLPLESAGYERREFEVPLRAGNKAVAATHQYRTEVLWIKARRAKKIVTLFDDWGVE